MSLCVRAGCNHSKKETQEFMLMRDPLQLRRHRYRIVWSTLFEHLNGRSPRANSAAAFTVCRLLRYVSCCLFAPVGTYKLSLNLRERCMRKICFPGAQRLHRCRATHLGGCSFLHVAINGYPNRHTHHTSSLFGKSVSLCQSENKGTLTICQSQLFL